MTSTKCLIVMGAMFALLAISVTMFLSLANPAPPVAMNGPTGFSFPSGVPQDSFSTAAVNSFFETALNQCETSADAELQQKGLTVDAVLSAKVNRICGCSVDYITANLTNDDVHAAGFTAHEQALVQDAKHRCLP